MTLPDLHYTAKVKRGFLAVLGTKVTVLVTERDVRIPPSTNLGRYSIPHLRDPQRNRRADIRHGPRGEKGEILLAPGHRSRQRTGRGNPRARRRITNSDPRDSFPGGSDARTVNRRIAGISTGATPRIGPSREHSIFTAPAATVLRDDPQISFDHCEDLPVFAGDVEHKTMDAMLFRNPNETASEHSTNASTLQLVRHRHRHFCPIGDLAAVDRTNVTGSTDDSRPTSRYLSSPRSRHGEWNLPL